MKFTLFLIVVLCGCNSKQYPPAFQKTKLSNDYGWYKPVVKHTGYKKVATDGGPAILVAGRITSLSGLTLYPNLDSLSRLTLYPDVGIDSLWILIQQVRNASKPGEITRTKMAKILEGLYISTKTK